MMNFKTNFLIGMIVFLLFLSFFSCKKQGDSEIKKLNQSQVVNIDDKASEELLLNIIQNEKYLSGAASIASERALNQDLKTFAIEAKAKHNKNFENFKVIYESKAISIPENLPKKYREELYKLTISNAADFDKYFQKKIIQEIKLELDSISKIINENKFIESQEILLKISNDYIANIQSLEKIEL